MLYPHQKESKKKGPALFLYGEQGRYYAYTFGGETVTVVDACHAQNMHE